MRGAAPIRVATSLEERDGPRPDAPKGGESEAREPKASPLSLTASDGTGLQIVSLRASGVVQEPLAFTELAMTFKNPERRTIEGQFRIALPTGASVSRFAMKIGSVWQEGEVVERQAARRAYEDFLHRRQDPALLEQGAGNEFTARVFPIPANGTKEIIISYSQELSSSDQKYRIPLVGLPRLENLSVRVLVGEEKRAVTMEQARWVPNADFEVASAHAEGRLGVRSEDLVVARITPMVQAEPEPIGSLLVLIDTSASRALGFQKEIALARKVISALAEATPVAAHGCDLRNERMAGEGPATGAAPMRNGRACAPESGAAPMRNGRVGAPEGASAPPQNRRACEAPERTSAPPQNGRACEAPERASAPPQTGRACEPPEGASAPPRTGRACEPTEGASAPAQNGHACEPPERTSAPPAARTRSEVQVAIAAFDQAVEPIYDGDISGLDQTAFRKILARKALGASDLEHALAWIHERLTSPEAWRYRRVVLITDGVATAGSAESEPLQRRVRDLANVGVERLDAIAVGGIRDQELLSRLVTAGLPKHGTVLDGDQEPQAIARRLTSTTHPKIQIAVEGASWSWPREIEGFQAGDQLLVYARLPKEHRFRLTLGGVPMSVEDRVLIAAERPLVERAVAKAKIADLIQQRGALFSDSAQKERQDLEKEIVALSTQHRVLSPLTALLVLETAADYARFHIDRRALSDILTVHEDGLAVLKRRDAALAQADNNAHPSPNKAPHAWDKGGAKDGSVGGKLIAAKGEEGLMGKKAKATAEAEKAEPRPAPSNRVAGPVVPGVQGQPGQGRSYLFGNGGLGGQLKGALGDVTGAERNDADGLGDLGTRGSGTGGGGSAVADGIGTSGTLSPNSAGLGGLGVRRPATEYAASPPAASLGPIHARGSGAGGGYAQPIGRGSDDEARQEAQAHHLARRAPAAATPMEIARDSSVRGRALDLPLLAQQAANPREVIAQLEAQMGAVYPYTGEFSKIMNLIGKKKLDEAQDRATAWHEESPGDVMGLVALGEAFEARGDLASAARAYGSLIDLFPSRADLRRFAGERLERIQTQDALRLAIDTYEKAVAQRPDHPASHRLLAYALLKNGEHERAFRALEAGARQSYPAGRFAGVDRILREDLGLIAAAWTKAQPARKAEIQKALRSAGGIREAGPSLRFVLNWETDANDVDFHIIDSHGGHAFYASRALPSGGELYADVTTGYGPECFTIRSSPRQRANPYKLLAHYYSRGPMGYGMGKLEIIEHDGHGGLSFDERPFVVMADHAFVKLGTVGRTITSPHVSPGPVASASSRLQARGAEKGRTRE